MKVLQVNCVYGTGSTGKITAQIHETLYKHGVKSVVCYGRGDRIKSKGIYKTCGEFYSKVNHFFALLKGQMYGGCYFSTRRLLSVIRKEKPDVVHLQCINGFFVNIPCLISWLKKNRIKTVLTLHAEFMFTANCGYARKCERWKTGCGKCPQLKTEMRSFWLDGTHGSWIKMKKAFSRFRKNLVVVSVSPWLMERAIQSPILEDKKHRVVLNGIDTKIFFPRETTGLRKKYRQADKIAIFVTTYLSDDENDIKGGHYVIKLAEMLKNEKIIVIVVGKYDATLTLPENMIVMGPIENQNLLAQYYSIADVAILASKRETFSMVTAESLCCGTPVVGFEAGGPESIALPEYSEFVPQEDLQALRVALLKMLVKKINRKDLAREAREQYSGERMVREYLKLYKELM